MTLAFSHTLSRPARSAHFSAPVKLGIRPRAPGNRATRRACISDQTASLISSFDIRYLHFRPHWVSDMNPWTLLYLLRESPHQKVSHFKIPEIPPSEDGGSFNSTLERVLGQLRNPTGGSRWIVQFQPIPTTRTTFRALTR